VWGRWRRPTESARREVRGPQRWQWVGEQWRPWLRRSPVGVEVLTRWQQADEYLDLLGDVAYREQLVQVLSRAVARDCAAAGFGCTRRSDRSCQGPEVCAQDPVADPGREGPVPGGCDTFTGTWGDHLQVWVGFSAGHRHSAVMWWDDRDRVLLWVDGTPVGEQHTLDRYGHWISDRHFVVQVQGPQEHPAQAYAIGSLVTTVRSVLIHDAEQAVTQLLEPRSDETWTDPSIVRHGDELRVYPDRTAVVAGAPPDRTLPIT
jgi:hypothetical protein